MTGAEGFAAIPNWMVRDADVSWSAIAVYIALASHSGPGGIHPSQQTLALEARCSERQVRNALAELRALGVVEVVRRRRKDGKSTTVSNGYVLHPNGRLAADEERMEVPAPPAGTSDEGVKLPAQGDEATGTNRGVVPYTEEEPIEEEPTSAVEVLATVGQRFAQPLCDVLMAELSRNGVKAVVSKRWLDDARLLVDRDERDPREAKALIEWACRDAFWRANILSMPTFRKQFDKLRLARERGGVRVPTVEHGRRVDDILRARAAAGEQKAIAS